MMKRFSNQRFKNLCDSFFNSYAQVFFSKNRVFALILFLISFFDIYAGISGFIAVMVANGTAWFMGINRQKIVSGAYGFNALLVGLGFGIYFQPGLAFYILLVFIALLSLFITFAFEGVLGKYGLPYLSLPFLFGIWTVLIATKSYSGLNLSERGVYQLNDLYSFGGIAMVKLYEWFEALPVPEALRIYFKSLSAIFFQYQMFAGILIALGLLFYSRIAFLLTLIGFFAAYYFYLFIGADISELSYSYIGFNYILTAIAVGGFFIIPSRRSFLWVLLVTPLVAITMTSMSYLFSFYQLSVYSLPFNIIVLMFLYALKFREKNFNKLTPVILQEFSPERNVYRYKNYLQRFGSMPLIAIKLPFWGEWKITQSFNGKYTHKGDWKYACDFEIVDEDGKAFSGNGTIPEDYYCFNKPVTAPANGEVVEIDNSVIDNAIGDMNMEKNWGNTLVIKHAEKLYSQLSHLKQGSIKVQPGDSVQPGDLLAYCGNSGRSPQPHLHFQLQATPHIGSKTIQFPISSYIVNDAGVYYFKTADNPVQDKIVSNVLIEENLKKAFHFIPGESITFIDEKQNRIQWEIKTDIYNNTFFECRETGAIAWFKTIGEVFYFTAYKGASDTLLYYFFLSSFKVITAFYKNLTIDDELPLDLFPNKILLLLQDFIIPFYRFLFGKYSLRYIKEQDSKKGECLSLTSEVKFGVFNKSKTVYHFKIDICNGQISSFEMSSNNKLIKAKRI